MKLQCNKIVIQNNKIRPNTMQYSVTTLYLRYNKIYYNIATILLNTIIVIYKNTLNFISIKIPRRAS